jgi:hypothetical protein
LIKKIGLQPDPSPSAETSTPPRICPMTAPLASAIEYEPSARVRSAPSSN